MSATKLPLSLLQELPDISEIVNAPLKGAQRIKYTCFDVSKTLIVFGATSGGIYVFNRHPCEFVQLIPNKDGAITRLSIAPNEKNIAFANGKGLVTVTECDPASGHNTVTSKEHQGNEVTAMVWNGSRTVFTGDDTGKVYMLVLGQIPKAIFASGSSTIMHLDSRICQLDARECVLLVSTLTRSYVCDTVQEQYRQIGQKLRDGEYGTCFVTDRVQDDNDTSKYRGDVANGRTIFDMADSHMSIFSARPSSRLWEATIDGTVKKTHQYKQVLSRQPLKVIPKESYESGNVSIENVSEENSDGKSCNFPRLFSINSTLFSFKKDALYFLDTKHIDNTLWFDAYNDIVDCKIFKDVLYVWRQNGSLVNLKYSRIDKYLVKSYLDEKYAQCAKICNIYNEYFLANKNLSPKLHLLVGLRNKLSPEEISEVDNVLKIFENLKTNEEKHKGIVVVDNTYTMTASDDENQESTEPTFTSFKDLSLTMTDTLNTSKRILKEKWVDLEGKVKSLSETKPLLEVETPKRLPYKNDSIDMTISENIVHKEVNNEQIDVVLTETDKISKVLYQNFMLNQIIDNTQSINDVIENFYTCDIKEIHNMMLHLEEYCIKIGATELSTYMPNTIFLNYINQRLDKEKLLEQLVNDEVLYNYVINSFIVVNRRNNKLSLACECGFPIPDDMKTPDYYPLIELIQKCLWKMQRNDECMENCKRIPYMWREMLELQSDSEYKLKLILHIYDQKLLYDFLTKSSIETWNKLPSYFAQLKANNCLNCSNSFSDSHIPLYWDDIGAMMIKILGPRKAMRIFESNIALLKPGDLSMKFYHSCHLTVIFQDSIPSIVDTVYLAHSSTEALYEICQLLKNTSTSKKKSALPIIVAVNSNHWGLTKLRRCILRNQQIAEENPTTNRLKGTDTITYVELIDFLTRDKTDCTLCGLPHTNMLLLAENGLWVFNCGHIYHGTCLDVNKVLHCPDCKV